MTEEPDQRKIDDFAFHLFNITRGIGMEQGSGLLLQLLFLRWAAHEPDIERDHRRTWATLRNEIAHGRVKAGPLLQDALDQRLGPWGHEVSLPPDDDGRTIESLILQIDAWPFDTADRAAVRLIASRLFETTLRLRSERLSRAGGEMETPTSIARLSVGLAVHPGARVIDPACGIGTTLVEAAKHRDVALYGRDVNGMAVLQARMRFELAGAEVDLEQRDALRDWHGVRRYDAVLLQPPFGQKLGQGLDDYIASQLPFGGGSRRSADFVWLQLALTMTASGGRAVVLSPAGTLFRGGREGSVRREMLSAGVVEAVISLPPNMLAGTGIPSALWVLRGSPSNEHSGRVLVVNGAAVDHTVGPGRASLTDDGIDSLLATLSHWRASPAAFHAPAHLARVVVVDELDQEATLVPARLLETVPEESPARPVPPRRLLTQLRITNLKSFGGEARVELAPLTVIYGPNSAGKSSVLQSLLLLKQSIAANTLVTQGELTDAGSFEGLVHRHDKQRSVGLGVTYGPLDRWEVPEGVPDPSLMRSIDFSFGTDGAELPQQHHVRFRFGDLALTFPRSVHGRAEAGALPFALPVGDVEPVFEAIAEGDLLFPFDSRRIREGDEQDQERRRANRRSNGRRARRLLEQAGLRELIVTADGLLPAAKVDLDPVKSFFTGAVTGQDEGIVTSYVKRSAQLAAGAGEELRRLLGELTYLGPLRSAPQRYYNRASAAAGAGTSGEHIALHLFDNASEVDEVNDWLKALGIPYSLKVVPVRATGGTAIIGDNVAIVLTDTRSGIDVSPADVGFGVSQVLPIVVQLLATEEGVVCIEQPEIHIHPKLQTELADLMIYSTSEGGRSNQLIVETHSEHLLLRLQRRIREGSLPPNDVAVLYVEQNEHGTAHVRRLRLDDRGFFIDAWPAGFFDNALDEIFGGGE